MNKRDNFIKQLKRTVATTLVTTTLASGCGIEANNLEDKQRLTKEQIEMVDILEGYLARFDGVKVENNRYTIHREHNKKDSVSENAIVYVIKESLGEYVIIFDGANVKLEDMKYLNTPEVNLVALSYDYTIDDETATFYTNGLDGDTETLIKGDKISIIGYIAEISPIGEVFDKGVANIDIDGDGKKEEVTGLLSRGTHKSRMDGKNKTPTSIKVEPDRQYIGFLKAGTSIKTGYTKETRTLKGDEAFLIIKSDDGSFEVTNKDGSRTKVDNNNITSLIPIKKYVRDTLRSRAQGKDESVR